MEVRHSSIMYTTLLSENAVSKTEKTSSKVKWPKIKIPNSRFFLNTQDLKYKLVKSIRCLKSQEFLGRQTNYFSFELLS